MDDREPLAFPLDPNLIAAARPVDLARLRVAWTEDFGQAPVSDEIRAVFRDRIAGLAHLFRACDGITFDLGETDRSFDVIRAQNFVERYQAAYEKDPNSLGPNVRTNYEMGARMTLADMAWAHAEQTRIFRRFQAIFHEYDLVLSPTTAVTPFPWTELYVESLEGVKLKNYYHWLALAYCVTLATNPAISLPCGADQHGMPFGLQVVGRFRGDGELLDAAEAMEQAFAAIPALRRPRPDLNKLEQPNADLKSIVTHPPLLQQRA
jgi:Asp-tRNA(Asn)/Glu-tRNA(Gln) amidotransferase A subunit family amidase